MPSKKDVHVSGSRADGFRATVNGRTVAEGTTQGSVEKVGREIAQRNESEIYLHRAGGEGRGQIRARDSFGHDPESSKG